MYVIRFKANMKIKSNLFLIIVLIFFATVSCGKPFLHSVRYRPTNLDLSKSALIVGDLEFANCIYEGIRLEDKNINVITEEELMDRILVESDEKEIDWLNDPQYLKLFQKENIKYLIKASGEKDIQKDTRWERPYAFSPLRVPVTITDKSLSIEAGVWEVENQGDFTTANLAISFDSSSHNTSMSGVPVFPVVRDQSVCLELGRNIAKLLLGKEFANEEKMPELYEAAAEGNEAKVNMILAQGIDFNNERLYRLYYQTALHIASSKGHKSIAKTLLAHGTDVNHQTESGMTALMAASERGHEELTQLLLANGADTKFQSTNGETALHLASSGGHQNVVETLLAHGTPINHQTTYGWSALMIASEEGHESIMKMLLAKGADVNIKSKYDETALYVASAEGHESAVMVLLGHGARVDQPTTHGWTPLTVASQGGGEAVVKALVAHGASVDHQDEDGWTPLMHAAKAGYEEVAKILLTNGADANLQSNNRLTALKVTEAKEMFRLLKSFGAK